MDLPYIACETNYRAERLEKRAGDTLLTNRVTASVFKVL